MSVSLISAIPRSELQAATSGDLLCDLSHQGLIAAVGPDTETFLQGQLTNDVRQLNPEHSQLSAYCSPKGRIVACFRLFRRHDTYYLRLPLEQLQTTHKRLGMFILRAKIQLQDAGNELSGLGLAGLGAEALLQQHVGPVPTDTDQVLQTGDISIIRVPGTRPRFELYAGLETLKNLWSSLAPQLSTAGPQAWRLLDILAGLPTVYPATQESFIPQMINLQLINGVSFRKGCYTGQEVIARTQHLGKLKRRMYLAHVDTSAAPQPGDALYSQSGSGVGTVVDASPHPDGGYALLAVAPIDCAETGTALLGNADGPPFEIYFAALWLCG